MPHIISATAIAALILATSTAWAGGNAAAGQQKSQACAACHGQDGNSPNPAYPRIAGQYESYLAKALHDYKSGARQNPIMAGMAAPLSEQDIADLAAYYSSQDGDLYQVEAD